MTDSYASSHLNKGADYHETFFENPHRAMLWTLERRALDEIVDKHLAGVAIRHLDFACGTGRVITHLAPQVAASTGLDVSPSMLDVAKKNLPEGTFVQANILEEDVLADDKFDLITAFRFFPNLENELRAPIMKKLVQRLAPGGLIVFNNHQNPTTLVRFVVKALGRTPDHEMPTHEVKELVTSAGLEIIGRRGLGQLPLTERHMPRPHRLWQSLEWALSHAPGTTQTAQDNVYICQARPK
jgi:predicted TPR repeat methyltransferase